MWTSNKTYKRFTPGFFNQCECQRKVILPTEQKSYPITSTPTWIQTTLMRLTASHLGSESKDQDITSTDDHVHLINEIKKRKEKENVPQVQHGLYTSIWCSFYWVLKASIAVVSVRFSQSSSLTVSYSVSWTWSRTYSTVVSNSCLWIFLKFNSNSSLAHQLSSVKLWYFSDMSVTSSVWLTI